MISPYEPAVGHMVLYLPHHSHVEKSQLPAIIVDVTEDSDAVHLMVLAPAGIYHKRGVPFGPGREQWTWLPTLVVRPVQLPAVDEVLPSS